MYALAGIIGLLLVGALHYYLWRRLVRDTTTSARLRRIGAWVFLLALPLLLAATLVVTRITPHGIGEVLAWPGFLWLALMFYLLVLLAILEIPAMVAKLVL